MEYYSPEDMEYYTPEDDLSMVYGYSYQKMIDDYLKLRGIKLSDLEPTPTKFQKYNMAMSELSKSTDYNERLNKAKADNFTNDAYEDQFGEVHEYFNEYRYNYFALMDEVGRIEYESRLSTKILSTKLFEIINKGLDLIEEKMESKKNNKK